MLEFKNVSYVYPFQARQAVKNISFSVAPGEVVLCTGASGCGKSTLMRLANGLCPHYYQGELSGEILVGGVPASWQTIYQLATQVGTLFQDPEQQFFALNVEDELAFVHEWRGIEPEAIHGIIRKAADDFGLGPVLNSAVHELSEGQKQKVGLASAMSQSPRMLILDEPSANLDPEATAELAAKLLALKALGLAILVVDHRLYWLQGVADRVIVMQGGTIREQGPFDLLHDEALCTRYGLRAATVADPRLSLPECGAAPARIDANLVSLAVSGLDFGYKGKAFLFQKADFFIPQGITAIMGGNGTGKTTLARLFTGLNKATAGTFLISGKPAGPAELLSRVGIVLQNADHQLHMKSVAREIEVCLKLARRLGSLPETAANALELLELFALAHLADRHPQSLSGGEKQRLVIACAFAKHPAALILDEPTSGLDGDNMRRIASVLRQMAARGACVLVITHDLELMSLVCERALRLGE